VATAPIPDLIQSFLDEAWEAVVVFEQTPGFLAISRFEPLVVMAHRLKGSAGIYGFSQISHLAALLERIFEGAPQYTDAQRIQVIEFVSKASTVLTEALDRISTTSKEGSVGLELGRLGTAELIQKMALANPDAFKLKAVDIHHDTALPELPIKLLLAEELQSYYRNNPEFWEFFAPEISENLDSVAFSLDGISLGDPQGQHLGALFRAMHTIKGAAYSVGCKPIGKLAHKLEDLLVAVREGGKPWNPAMAQLVADGNETIRTMLAVAEGKADRTQHLDQALFGLEARLAQMLGLTMPEAAVSAPTPADPIQAEQAQSVSLITQAPARGSVRVSSEKLDNLLDLAGETLATRARLELLVHRFEQLDEVLESARLQLARTTADFEARYLNPHLSLDAGKNESTPSNLGTTQSNLGTTQSNLGTTQSNLGKTVSELFSELEFDRYDDLNILARSISEMTSDLAEVRGELAGRIRSFRQETELFGKLSQNLRSEVGRARLVPVGRFYQRLQRQVQQVAGDKPLQLDFQGESLEIDSMVLDGLAEALVHLVNNAVIHGLENANERRVKGKPSKGRLVVRAKQQRNFLVLEVEDDGRGIDVEAIKQKAVAKGLRTLEQVGGLTTEQAINLVFLPGLSTAETVTAEAGRGVGLDVVASTVRRLRGEISIETRQGLGSTFRLRIPQTLVVSEILMLEVGGRNFALPRESVFTLLTASAETVEKGHIIFEDEAVKVLLLNQILGLPDQTAKDLSLALVEGREGLVALAGERFVGLEQVLVKPLSEPFSQFPHLTGATVSPTGEVILVLSPSGLLSMGTGSSAAIVEAAPVRQPLLLVDDSLSVRRIVGKMLRKTGHPVVTAADGQEALELLENYSFHAVITDLEMPRLSGFELLEEIRRRPNLAHLRVAVLTTRASSKHRDLAIELGADAYLTKPLDEIELDGFMRQDPAMAT